MQDNNERRCNGADRTPSRPAGISITFHPQVSSHEAFSQVTAVTPQLQQQDDEASLMVNYTVTKSENNRSSSKKAWKLWKLRLKSKKKRQNSNMTSAAHNQSQPLHNGADFTRTVEFHTVTSSAQSTAAFTRPQGSSSTTSQPNCTATTSTHSLPRFTARLQPLNTPANPKTHFLNAAAGPSSNNGSFPRTVRSFGPVLPSKYLAIDCEMVGTGPKGRISQVARCSLVSYDGDIVYDKFIKPPVPVTDYRTPWSGIRPHNLLRATPYAVARNEILRLVKGKVLIGHAIHNDLKVLSYSHPKDLTRDTSRIPLLNVKAGFQEREVVSLKRLTKALLKRDIQTGRKGHSSVEDAKATIELYKLVEMDLEQTPASKNTEPSK